MQKFSAFSRPSPRSTPTTRPAANTSQDVTLNIIGHHDVLVATGGGNDQVLLNDRGDDLFSPVRATTS
jgi:hypothetical protein